VIYVKIKKGGAVMAKLLTDYFSEQAAQNSEGLPKALLIDVIGQYRARLLSEGGEVLEAEMNMALFLTAGAMLKTKQHNGTDYIEHPMTVGLSRTDSYAKKIIGILHDLVEDTDWELDDLRQIGFSERIITGVDAVTAREGEYYFDFIVRCGLAGADAIDVKISDLKHNSDLSRSGGLVDFSNARDMRFLEKQRQVYVVAYNYLVAIKRGNIQPGASVKSFMDQAPQFQDYDLLARWSAPEDKDGQPKSQGLMQRLASLRKK
jgi:hypothetical protein